MLTWHRVECNEIPQLSQMGEETYLFHFGSSWENKKELSEFVEENYSINTLNEQFENPKIEWYFLEEGKPVGYCKLEINNGIKGIYIDKFYFMPNNTGKGFGRQAFRLIELLAYSRSIKDITLDVLESNQDGKRFYLSLGLEYVGENTHWQGSTNYVLHTMKKTL